MNTRFKLINGAAVLALITALNPQPSTLLAQTAPTLSLSMPAPGIAQLSWPSNFNTWQLMSASHLGANPNWQPVAGSPVPFGNTLVMFYVVTNNYSFFRLQQTNGGGGGGGDCTFQATPSTISSGSGSMLSWCADPDPSTTYQIFPGIGLVTGTNYVVFPTVTTVYTLVASNVTGVTSNSTTVTVTSSGCIFAAATNLSGTLSFSYDLTPSSSSVIYVVHESASVTVNLSRVSGSGNLLVFKGAMGGTATVNDSRTPLPDMQDAISVTGSGPPLAGQPANLTIDCSAGTYTFDFQPVIDATWSPESSDTTRVGSVFVNNRALPTSYGALASSGSLPARGPFWGGSGDWYFPGDLGEYMFYDGLVTDYTAGNASVSWSFTPVP